jgi:hypothetical protein
LSAPVPAASAPIETELLCVTVAEATLPDIVNVEPAVNDVLVTVFTPALLKVKASTCEVNGPTAPLPPLSASDAPINVPADCEMVPAFVAVSAMPPLVETVFVTVIEPLPPEVEAMPIAPVPVREPTERFWSDDRLSEPTFPDTVSTVPEAVTLEIVLLPELLRTRAFARVVIAPTAPVPPFKVTVGPSTCPAV